MTTSHGFSNLFCLINWQNWNSLSVILHVCTICLHTPAHSIHVFVSYSQLALPLHAEWYSDILLFFSFLFFLICVSFSHLTLQPHVCCSLSFFGVQLQCWQKKLIWLAERFPGPPNIWVPFLTGIFGWVVDRPGWPVNGLCCLVADRLCNWLAGLSSSLG